MNPTEGMACVYGTAEGDVPATIRRVISGTIVELEYRLADGVERIASDVPHFSCFRFGSWGLLTEVCRERGYRARGQKTLLPTQGG